MAGTAIDSSGGGSGKIGNQVFNKGSRGPLFYIVREDAAQALAEKNGRLMPLIGDSFGRLHVRDAQLADVIAALGGIDATNALLATLTGGVKVLSIGAGDERIGRVAGQLVSISDEKILIADGDYVADDVVSESITVGTPWLFQNVARVPGGSGYIMDSVLLAQTTNIAGWFSLYLFTRRPTCELSDGIPNTAVLAADRKYFVKRIDFPACSDLGTGSPDTDATPSTVGGLPKSFVCEKGSRDLWGVLAIRNVVDLANDTWLRVTLNVEQY